MIDEIFIKTILLKGKEAKEKVELGFSSLCSEQLNWKPSPKSWSIAQCLDHIIISDSAYFTDLEKIVTGTYKMSPWERCSPFTNLCGRLMKDRLQEQVKQKMTAPRKIQPSASEMGIEILERYHTNLDTFLELISNCRTVDIDKIVIPSPTIAIITYNLRDALTFLLQHEHRHINQAIRVKLQF